MLDSEEEIQISRSRDTTRRDAVPKAQGTIMIDDHQRYCEAETWSLKPDARWPEA